MRKCFTVLICLLICATLFGCTADKVENIAESTSHFESETVLEKLHTTTAKNNSTTTEKSTKEETTTQEKTTEKKKETTAKGSTEKKVTAKKASESTTKSTTTSASSSEPAHSTTQTTATDSEPEIFNCTFSIDCTQILDNKDKLKAGHLDYLPSNAIILDAYTCEVKKGETVFDVLERVCSENNIKLTVKSDMYGKYIIGFDNIDEKDCGARSGWTYTVNGAYPPKSCDKYILSQNDKVVFIYTCS